MRKIEEFWIEFDEKPPKAPIKSFIFDVTDSLKGAVIVAFVVFCMVFRVIGVEGTSMYPTLNDGDWIAVSGHSFSVDRGDIIVANPPWERNVPIVKRVIAIGGDTVNIDFISGNVYVNDVKLDEPYIDELTTLQGNVSFPLEVPEGTVFVMGDNRGNSLDSRSSKIGCVDERYILGEMLFRFYNAENKKPDKGVSENG